MCVCVCVCVCVGGWVSVYICIYIHIDTHIYSGVVNACQGGGKSLKRMTCYFFLLFLGKENAQEHDIVHTRFRLSHTLPSAVSVSLYFIFLLYIFRLSLSLSLALYI